MPKETVNKQQMLNEISQSHDQRIIDAINKVVRVRMTYNDRQDNFVLNYEKTKLVGPDKGKNERYILPVAYGLTKSGKRAIRAFETAGSTRRGVPHWKLFLLDNIVSWANGHKSFKNYAQQLINMGLNTQGDKGMTTLFAITPIADSNVQVAKDTNPIDSNPISKSEVSPTQSLQQPQTTDRQNYVSAQSQRIPTIDKTQSNNYFKNKVESPDTTPITKQDVATEPEVNNKTQSQQPTNAEQEPSIQNAPETKPVTKDEVDNQENKLTSTFKDLTDRMNNLYKDNDEKEIN